MISFLHPGQVSPTTELQNQQVVSHIFCPCIVRYPAYCDLQTVAAVGSGVGDEIGDFVGAVVGACVGDVVGTWVGEAVGALVGSM